MQMQCMTVCKQANMPISCVLPFSTLTTTIYKCPFSYCISSSPLNTDDPDYVPSVLAESKYRHARLQIVTHCVFMPKFLYRNMTRLATSSNICVPLMKWSPHNRVCSFGVQFVSFASIHRRSLSQ